MLNRSIPILSVAALGTWLAPAAAQTVGDCDALEDLRIEDTNILSSGVAPAGDDLPEYCWVRGYVRPAINFEIRLPTKEWNGKFYMAGCGAQCGRLLADRPGFNNAMNHGLRRNYASVTMDGGHWGSEIWDRRWTEVNDPIARFDFDQRAVTETARVSKEVIAAYYGRAPEKSYFAGCSNGGRQANMEAWKYPEDFDGIISGCPVLYSLRWELGWVWKTQATIGRDGKIVLAFSKLPMIAKAVYDACAGEDGLIDDPEQCQFEPSSLACQGADGADCLTAPEIETLEKWYGGARNSKGEQIYPGVPLGSEPYWSALLAYEDDAGSLALADMARNRNYLRYLGFVEDPGPGYEVDFDKDPERLKDGYANRTADGTDLSKFKERGGKLLIYHGLADVDVAPEATRQWYEALTKDMGGDAGTMEFARLFMVPGMSHCGIPSGPGVADTGFDPLPALEKWVEEGVTPESIVMTKTTEDGKTEWTRPVCVYPQVAAYKGSGDLKDAANWTCGGA
jgi:Tannase and feruloyl esterase